MTVYFPDLGFDVQVNPTAFTLFGHSFQWYGIIIAVGFVLAFIYAMASCKKFRINQDKLLDAVIVGIIGGVIGARLYYVLFYPGDKYINDPLSALYIWEGGLGIYGGIIGGLLCGGLIAKWRKLSVPAVLDLASICFLIGQCIGRWGNFVNQEAFGSETTLPWGMASANTGWATVHPCFLYESLWCLLGFVLLHFFSRKLRRYDGQVFLLYLIWYGVGRFFIESLRTDSLYIPILPIKVSQVVAVLSVLAGVVLLIVFRNRTKLTGCGSKKIMELNAIVDEIPEEEIDDGKSTVLTEDHAEDSVVDDDSVKKENLTEEDAEQEAEEKSDDSADEEEKKDTEDKE